MFAAVLISLPLAAGQQPADPKPEPPPAPVKAVLDGYLKALAAKDAEAMTALSAVPWLDRGRQVVRDRAGLAAAVKAVAGQLPADKGKRKVETFPYKAIRPRIDDAAAQKLLDEVVGEDGWYAFLEDDGYPLSLRSILIRVKGGKPAVVAGPLKENQLTNRNPIPEAVEKLLDKAETCELYSLDPDVRKKAGNDGFHGYVVLGKTAVKPADRKKLADGLRAAAEDNFGMVAACFIPRHGLRLTADGKTVDLVICFQCMSIQVYTDDKQEKGFLTTGDPQSAFDAVLKAAGVKLPKQADD